MRNGKVGIGIVGAGNIAALHARVIKDLPQAELIGIYDVKKSAAEAMAANFGCQAFSDYSEFLSVSEMDAVTIATPSGLHGTMAIPAAKAGKHVFCEKPLDITLEKADDIIKACEKNNVILSPVFQGRFARPVQLVKEAMRTGRFGRMVLASGQMRWYREAAYYSGSNWRGTWKMDGGGALMNQAIHMVDMLLYINGAPDEVFAFSGTLTHSIEVEDNLCAAIKYRNGSFGTIEVSTSCAPGFHRRVEFSGSGGTVAFEEDKITIWEFTTPQEGDDQIVASQVESRLGSGGRNPMGIADMGHRLQMEDFCNAILENREPQLGGSEGRRAVELICGIYESARTGKPYKFSR